MAKFNKQYTHEQVAEAAKNAFTYADIFRNLGIKMNGGSYTWMKDLLSKFSIDISHFPPRNSQLSQAGLKSNVKTMNDLYKSKDVSSGYRKSAIRLRSFMFFYELEERCAICNINSWLNNPLRLDIDHKDGNPLNNKLDNLQFICPNCHRQKTNDIPLEVTRKINTINGEKIVTFFEQQKIKRIREKQCFDCNATIHYGSKRCRDCARKAIRKQKSAVGIPTADLVGAV